MFAWFETLLQMLSTSKYTYIRNYKRIARVTRAVMRLSETTYGFVKCTPRHVTADQKLKRLEIC